jgi:RNA polymerase sigma factor (TIGR02999 family)
MDEVTRILTAIDQGDPQAANQLLPLVYDELRRLAAAKLAQETPGQTLQATALVHEAFLRLVGSQPEEGWSGRGHFFGAAAEAMRRILVESARRRQALKRGGNLRQEVIPEDAVAAPETDEELLAVNEVLDEFAAIDPVATRLVKLRYFTGLSMQEAADAMGISLRTAERQWTYAKAWLFRRLQAG